MFEITAEIIIAITAVYGAVVSTLSIILRWLDKRKKIEVKTGYGLPTSQAPSPGATPPYLKDETIYLTIKAINKGNQVVNLSDVGLRLPNGARIRPEFSNFTGYSDGLPYELKPKSSTSVFVPIGYIKSTLKDEGYPPDVKLKPYFRDEVEEEYIGEEFNLNSK